MDELAVADRADIIELFGRYADIAGLKHVITGHTVDTGGWWSGSTTTRRSAPTAGGA
jgi:hypothetical protein